jgi:hypothetical protein
MAVGATRRLRIKNTWSESACLYIVGVADTGTKKSPAAAAMMRPVEHRQEELLAQYTAAVAAYKNAVRHTKAGDPKPDWPKLRQAYTSNQTVEAVVDLLKDNHRGLGCFNDELSAWVLGMNAYRPGADRQFWLSVWGSRPYQYNRKGAGGSGRESTYLENPYVAVYGCMPPDVLPKLCDRAGGEDGFVDRLLFCYPETSASGWSDAEESDEVGRAYEELIASLYSLNLTAAGEPKDIPLTSEARECFRTFCTNNTAEMRESGFPANLRGPWAKMEGQCARLALIHQLALKPDAEAVDAPSVEAAVKLCNYFQNSARRVHARLLAAGSTEQERDTAAVLDWVAKAPCVRQSNPPTFTWSQVRRDLHNRFESRDDCLRTTLTLLEGRGYIREVEQVRNGTRGRNPKPAYLVNPHWLGASSA